MDVGNALQHELASRIRHFSCRGVVATDKLHTYSSAVPKLRLINYSWTNSGFVLKELHGLVLGMRASMTWKDTLLLSCASKLVLVDTIFPQSFIAKSCQHEP